MSEGLGKRICREYGWFALVLFVLLIGCAERLLPSAEMQSQAAGSQPSPAPR